MAHAARAHVTWMSAVIIVAVTVSCVTWLIVSRETRVIILNGTSVADMFRFPASRAYCLCKVINNTEKDEYLRWKKMWCDNISLNESNNIWMTVQETGVYMVYVQLTYGLKTSSRVDLSMILEFSYAEGTEEFTGAFDTRQPTENEQDAHLSKFFLLKMKAGNRLSIKAYPKDMIKYDDHHPFTSFVTIVRYADWSG
ncbi:uncharacterized protein si:dkey-220k22.3 [Tachysurus vachellii]|uniref:uncharacterized protein si:dkey-220k22.3 n=1 Tax=Tachysurus vachellii TaxID=175792 RepID=UPI00296B0E5B|nr:uncharacterized protein si:dkey-220k22.3 [Tachysurus vachellii]